MVTFNKNCIIFKHFCFRLHSPLPSANPIITDAESEFSSLRFRLLNTIPAFLLVARNIAMIERTWKNHAGQYRPTITRDANLGSS